MNWRFFAAALLVPMIAGWGDAPPSWPVNGPMPDRPVGEAHSTYAPVLAGTKTYRPVEPMPWGAVNRRVAPEKSEEPSGTMQHQGH
jgi:hypothetical protein